MLQPPGAAITWHLHSVFSFFPRADSTLSLEAQQKYSTGYIQCMHEVHNMLLTCDWMDKTLGSRLLNHLLKSLPRSTDARPLQGVQRQDVQPPPARLPATPLRADPHAGRQSPAGHRERPALQSCQLGMLEMWRPWWRAVISVAHLVRSSSVMYLIDMLLRRKKTCMGRFCSSEYCCRCAIMILYCTVLPFRSWLLVACIIEGSY